MPFALRNPQWTNDLYNTTEYLRSIKDRLNEVVSVNPEVTVCIIAKNEEINIIKCLDSLSRSVSTIPFEIVVVNNGSTDGTQKILDALEVRNYFQPIPGCGPSREMGQQNARGKYVLLADADCLYPSAWVETMCRHLMRKGIVAVYGRHSFLGDDEVPRWKFAIYEIGKDLIQEVRHLKRPYLNAYGMSFGYIRNLGLREGFATRNIRGEDGRLCFDLMKYGKIVAVRDRRIRVWTSARNFSNEGGLRKAIEKRLLREALFLRQYFEEAVPHDTKNSENIELSAREYKALLMKRIGSLKNNLLKKRKGS